MSKFKILAFLKNPLALLYIFSNQTLNANFNYFLKGRLQFKKHLWGIGGMTNVKLKKEAKLKHVKFVDICCMHTTRN